MKHTESKLTRLRERAGFVTDRDWALAAGISQNVISCARHGHVPNRDNLDALCAAARCSWRAMYGAIDAEYRIAKRARRGLR